jgi:hypothetical protein
MVAVQQWGDQNQQRGHERSASHVTKRYKVPRIAEKVFADDSV